MKALILSGGKGTRLQPITHTSAKQLVPIANKPVLFYALEAIVAAGITDIGIIVGDTHEEIEAATGDGKDYGNDVHITYIHQDQPLGLAHAVKVAQPFLQKERFLLFLGDNFIEGSLAELVQQFSEPTCPFQAQVLLKLVSHPEQFGVAQLCQLDGSPLDPDKTSDYETARIMRLVEKPQEPVSNLALVGIYFLDEHIFAAIDAIQPSKRGELEITDAIQHLIDDGYVVRPHILTGYWTDTGKMQDMLDANRVILSRIKGAISPEAYIDQDSELHGEVILEENVRLINSVVRGPSAIGRNVTLLNAYVGPFTSIARNTVVENSEIEHSIVLEGCNIHDVDGRIEGSLIGRHTQIYPSSAKPRAYKLLLGDNSQLGVL